ncbi:MAG TPA: TetR/AcrR family transcriptional regulator [Polyangiaceae bacterium]|jgi:AcrR family transcriptional regulator|nr:TetR/AcrR family transcriptional regulator [Polyangiaceae bacterium]
MTAARIQSVSPDARPDAQRSEVRAQNPLRDHFARTRIIEAAAKVFPKKGIQATTVEDLLAAADVCRRTFYRLFSSKYDALDALHEVMTSMLMEERRAAYSVQEPPWKKLERMVDTTVGFARRNRALVRMLHGEAQRPDSPLATRRLAFLDTLATEFAENLSDVIGLRPDPFVLRGLLFAHEGILHSMLDVEPVDDATVARAKAAIIRLTAATLSAQGAHLPPLPLDTTARSHRSEKG